MINCDWCGAQAPIEAMRLILHRGKKEVWCQLCAEEDAWGSVSSLRSVHGRKRKKDRPQQME